VKLRKVEASAWLDHGRWSPRLMMIDNGEPIITTPSDDDDN